MQWRLEARQRRATVVYVVRRGHCMADVGQQAIRIYARGRSDLKRCRCRTIEPLPHSIKVYPDGADDGREVRDQGQHRGIPWAVRRLQLELVADSNVQSLAEVLRQHHSSTGEHRIAHLITDRAVERVGGAGGKPVEHHARPTDLGEPGCALGDTSYPRHRGHLVGKILRQRVDGIAVGRIGTHPHVDARDRRENGSCRTDHVGVRTGYHDGGDHRDEHRHHRGPDPPRRPLDRRRGQRSNRSENPGRRGCGLDHDCGQREAERDLSAE